MTKNIHFKDLYMTCKYESYENVVNRLKNDNDLDVLIKDGKCIFLAANNNNPKLLKLLISYYLKNINSDNESLESTETDSESSVSIEIKPRSLEYNIAIYKLKDVLLEAEARFFLSKEVEAIINKYLGRKDSDYDSEDSRINDFNEPDFEDHTDSSSDAKLNSSDEEYPENINKEEDPAAAFYAELAADHESNSDSNSASGNYSNPISVSSDVSQTSFEEIDAALVGALSH